MIRRYNRTKILGFGSFYGTSGAILAIRNKIATGEISFIVDVVRGFERLDTIAGREYGDGTLWWVIAAASGIGWGLQVPPGTVIKIPKIEDVARFTG